MEPAKATYAAPPPTGPAIAEPGLLTTWPRCVQVAVAVLLALGIGYLLGRSFAGAANPDPASEVVGPRLDLNRASRAELTLLPGLGPARAESIESYRAQHGPFRDLNDLAKVPGIGPKTLDRLRAWVFVDTGTSDTQPPAPAPAAMPIRPAAGPAPPAAVPHKKKGKKEAQLTAPINVNLAGAAELQKLPGVGPKLAQRIIDERTLRGRFRTVEELRRVPGIGAKTLERLRPYVIVAPPAAGAGS